MKAIEARCTAAEVSQRVHPGVVGVALVVETKGEEVNYVIWTANRGPVDRHVLSADHTSTDRLEAHLRGFCAAWAHVAATVAA